MRHLLLFDIDGTLVRGGPAKGAFHEALEEVFGTAGPIQGHVFSGKTDPQIARELLEAADFSTDEIDKGLPALWEAYLSRMAERLPETPMELLPGVVELLERLDGMGAVGVGLLTGNVQEGAMLKLGSVGLADHFAIGSYGSDSETREDLPELAMERAAEKWGLAFHPQNVCVIGDTPRDVDCGRFAGTRTVAVATGRYDVAALEETEADHVLADMGNLDQTLKALLQ